MRTKIIISGLAGWMALGASWVQGAAGGSNSVGALDPAGVEFFENRIRPLLVSECIECHGTTTKQKGGLVLDRREGWVRGGDSGPALIPGDPDGSRLIQGISYQNPDFQMPPKKRLAPEQIEDLKRWIAMGAPDPRDGTIESPQDAAFNLHERKESHWAWKTPERPEVPQPLQRSEWPANDVDRFILQRLEASGLAPAPRAERAVLLRRLFYDLTGLPPSVEETEAFLSEENPQTYEQWVDALLSRPQFGENWGQHWLDLVRYAETWGHEADFGIPHAWRYRDYVIRALNADVPYDQFLVEHIAGDLVQPPRMDPKTRMNESILGTGFWHMGEATHSPVDILGDESIRRANQIDVFSKAFQAMTLACARCHDHKFDAITTRDYYALYGYLQSSSFHLADISDPVAQEEAREALTSLRQWGGLHLKRKVSESLVSILPELGNYWDTAIQVAAKAEPLVREDDKGLYYSPDVLNEAVHGKVLDVKVLEAWALEWNQAAKQPGHLLFGMTQAKDAVKEAWERKRAESERSVAGRAVVFSEKLGELNYVKSTRPFDPAKDKILDYRSGIGGWLASGHRFGKGPAERGDLILGKTEERPIQRIVLEPGAESEGLSSRFSGLIRSPSFFVNGDHLWIRYRGEAEMFMEVDSHRVCQGPLHSGNLRKHLKCDGEGYVWASYEVYKYTGHRVHLEFTPKGDFSLSRVEYGQVEPVELFQPDPVTLSLLETEGELNGTRFVERLRSIVESWGEGRSLEAGGLEWVNWLITHPLVLNRMNRVWGEEFRTYTTAKEGIEKTIPEPVLALALVDGSGMNEPVHIRGNHRNVTDDSVRRSYFEALVPEGSPLPERGSGRLELALELVDSKNPLTSRVMVNRIWHHLFGKGLVAGMDNFGATGDKPSHPELLDFLAVEFVDRGWSIKSMIRMLVLSSTYQMSSEPLEWAEAKDPNNVLLHRMPIRRLTGEAVRDGMLAVSGRLDPSIFGPSVMVHISDFMRNNRSPGGSGPLDGNGRRSIYVEARRNHLEPMLLAFDKPTPFTAIGRRNVSNSPAQPLIMLNNPLVHEQSRIWAERLLREEGLSDADRVRLAYRMAFTRLPDDWELEAALEFLKEGGEDRVQVWTDLAHTLFNVKEFIFIN